MCKKIFNENNNDNLNSSIKELILKISKKKGLVNVKA